ncbi:hypothetical protein BH18ACT1_BH18ACT1_05620 [soil metagenome]
MGPPDPTFTSEPRALTSRPVPVLLVPLAAAGLVAWRRRAGAPLALVVVVSVALVVGSLSVARTIGLIYTYRLRWTWVVGVTAAIAVAWTAWVVVGAHASVAARRGLGAVLVVGAVAVTAVNTADAVRSDVPQEELSSAVGDLLVPVRRAIPTTRGVVLVRTNETFVAYGFGIFLQLEREGIDVRVEDVPGSADALGRHRIHRGEPVRAVVDVLGGERLDRLIISGERLTAYAGHQPLGERAALLRRCDRLARANADGRLSDEAYVEQQLVIVRRLGTAVGVIVE